MMMVMQFTTLLSLLMALLAVITSVAGNLTALKEDAPMPKNVEKCFNNAKFQAKMTDCAKKYEAELLIHPCKVFYNAFVCEVDTICSECDPNDAIDTEKYLRENLADAIIMDKNKGFCKNYQPPKPLDKPFCTPPSGLPLWAIILIVVVVLAVCCCCGGLLIYFLCCAGEGGGGQPNRNASGHSAKGGHPGGSGGGGPRKGSKGSHGKRHSSGAHHSSHHSHHS